MFAELACFGCTGVSIRSFQDVGLIVVRSASWGPLLKSQPSYPWPMHTLLMIPIEHQHGCMEFGLHQQCKSLCKLEIETHATAQQIDLLFHGHIIMTWEPGQSNEVVHV